MSDEDEKGGSLLDIFSTAVRKRPLLLMIVLWSIVYLPLAFCLSAAIEEETYDLTLGSEDLILEREGLLIYRDDATGVMGYLRDGGSNREMSLRSGEGFIPMRLELVGYGKIYTNEPYDENRTWDVSGALRGGDLRNSTWKIRIDEKVTDVPFYRDRGMTLLEGKLLYRDVHTFNPPLINVLWIVPAALGGSFLVFRLYFAIWALVAGIVAFGICSKLKGAAGTKASFFILFNPLTLYSTVGAAQDDILMMLAFMVVLGSLMQGWRKLSSATLGLGIATKVFTVLLLPGMLMGKEKMSEKLKGALITVCIPAVALLPFFILAPDEVWDFISLYITGDSGGRLHGISLWRYALDVGIYPSSFLMILPVALVLLGIGVMVRHFRDMDGVRAGWTFTLLFLLLFPKIHSGYYLLLLPFALHPSLTRGRPEMRYVLLSASLLVICADLANGFGWPDGGLVWMPLLMAVSISIILLYLLRVFAVRSNL